ncbi:MAG: 30S ribosomal protein S3 [Candidatus Shikimatogenerans bostrichidophilus]|nr:MAG: 30S ribosomal protein S3 [Candidatus Shikimatogenerans bostrichidophilus]
MGQKTNPISNRLGLIYGWQSIWINNYLKNVKEDNDIREYINKRFNNRYCISNILIERTSNKIIISICTSKPAIVIGKKGKEVNNLKENIKKIIFKNIYEYYLFEKKKKISKIKNILIYINVIDIIKPEMDALLVAKNICRQIRNRVSYKKAIKLSIFTALKMKALGIKIQISGRLNGAEMARTETYKKGIIKLSTFRSNIDYGLSEVNTNYGKIGVKVWIMKGVIYKKMKDFSDFYKRIFKIKKKEKIKIFVKKK